MIGPGAKGAFFLQAKRKHLDLLPDHVGLGGRREDKFALGPFEFFASLLFGLVVRPIGIVPFSEGRKPSAIGTIEAKVAVDDLGDLQQGGCAFEIVGLAADRRD